MARHQTKHTEAVVGTSGCDDSGVTFENSQATSDGARHGVPHQVVLSSNSLALVGENFRIHERRTRHRVKNGVVTVGVGTESDGSSLNNTTLAIKGVLRGQKRIGSDVVLNGEAKGIIRWANEGRNRLGVALQGAISSIGTGRFTAASHEQGESVSIVNLSIGQSDEKDEDGKSNEHRTKLIRSLN